MITPTTCKDANNNNNNMNQNAKKSPGDLRKLAVSQTPVENPQLIAK